VLTNLINNKDTKIIDKSISLFHRAFFITIVSLTPTHALVLSYTKIT